MANRGEKTVGEQVTILNRRNQGKAGGRGQGVADLWEDSTFGEFDMAVNRSQTRHLHSECYDRGMSWLMWFVSLAHPLLSETAAKITCDQGRSRTLVEPGGNFVMSIRSREIGLVIVALKDVCDWLIARL